LVRQRPWAIIIADFGAIAKRTIDRILAHLQMHASGANRHGRGTAQPVDFAKQGYEILEQCDASPEKDRIGAGR